MEEQEPKQRISPIANEAFISKMPPAVADSVIPNVTQTLLLYAAWQQYLASQNDREVANALASTMADADSRSNYIAGMANAVDAQACLLGCPEYFNNTWRPCVSTLTNMRDGMPDSAIAFVVHDGCGSVLRSFPESHCDPEYRSWAYANTNMPHGRDRAEKWSRVYHLVMNLVHQSTAVSKEGLHALATMQLHSLTSMWSTTLHYSLYLRPLHGSNMIEVCNAADTTLLYRIQTAGTRASKCPTVLSQDAAHFPKLYACIASLLIEAGEGACKGTWLVDAPSQFTCSLEGLHQVDRSVAINVPLAGTLLRITPDGTVLSSDMACNAGLERRLLAFLGSLERGSPDAVLAVWHWGPESSMSSLSSPSSVGNKRRKGTKPTKADKRLASERRILEEGLPPTDIVPPPTLAETVRRLAEMYADGVVDVSLEMLADDRAVAASIGKMIGGDYVTGTNAIHDVWRMATNGMTVPAYTAERVRAAALLCDHLGVDTKQLVEWLRWRVVTEQLPVA
jgi:hypothetical protein